MPCQKAGRSIPMSAVRVRITRFVSDDQPGFVECVLVDAFGHSHLFIEKAPVVCAEELSATSLYPVGGSIACEIDGRDRDEAGRPLLRIRTDVPFGIESTAGDVRFVVPASDVLA
jgi:hypothetical protein